METVIETSRCRLRRLEEGDWDGLCGILQDAQTMYAYEHAFTGQEVREWLDRQLARYEKDGVGLWAVLSKEDGSFLGQAGITMQEAGEMGILPEIGYLFNRRFWHQGYAIETAAGLKEYGFQVKKYPLLCSIIRENNLASRKVAERNGMTVTGRLVKHYYQMEMPHLIYTVKNEGQA